jgi:hypothetical protein
VQRRQVYLVAQALIVTELRKFGQQIKSFEVFAFQAEVLKVFPVLHATL